MKYKLYKGDCLKRLEGMKPVQVLFADPPDNINLGYEGYKDKLPEVEYVVMLGRWLSAFTEKAQHVWFSFNARWTAEVGAIVYDLVQCDRTLEYKACTQVFTFGQHNKHDLGNNHRPLWRISRKNAPLYPDAIKVPSWRQRNGDKRAAPGGRVPGDVFDMQYPSPAANRVGSWLSAALDDPNVCEEMKRDILAFFEVHAGDVFDFPRVTGNSAQRQDWHPTQLHEDLVERCIKLTAAPGDNVIDPFGGTGTTLRVCERLKQPCTLIELDETYCKKIVELHKLKVLRTPGGWGK